VFFFVAQTTAINTEYRLGTGIRTLVRRVKSSVVLHYYAWYVASSVQFVLRRFEDQSQQLPNRGDERIADDDLCYWNWGKSAERIVVNLTITSSIATTTLGASQRQNCTDKNRTNWYHYSTLDRSFHTVTHWRIQNLEKETNIASALQLVYNNRSFVCLSGVQGHSLWSEDQGKSDAASSSQMKAFWQSFAICLLKFFIL